MPSICYIGHKFHKQTLSTRFLIDILKTIGEVQEYYSTPDEGKDSDNELLHNLITSDFECYVFLQTEYIAKRLIEFCRKRFVIIPMYDGSYGREDIYWNCFINTQFISFSRAHHELLQRLQCKSAYFRFFPPLPERQMPITNHKERSAFFWERRPDTRLNISLAIKICKLLNITKLHVHQAYDFPPQSSEMHIYETSKLGIELTVSKWFENRADLEAIASQTTFFFAPRLREGIGMSFLEAMSRGQIVIAPDSATMNEYISHGVTGILYNPTDPQINFDLSGPELIIMRNAIINKAKSMRLEWIDDIPRFKDLIIGNNVRYSTRDYSSNFLKKLRVSASIKANS